MKNETAVIEEIQLKPSYNLPIILILTGISLTIWQMTAGIIIAVIGLCLLIQASIIKLTFTQTALVLYRQQTKIRSFPYSDWENWVIFSASVPVLLYFKEVKSIHFLPIIFNPVQLKSCLEKYCPRIENKTN